MKPLTIEEIKKLSVNEWIYIIDLTDLIINDYYKISQLFESEIKTLFNYKAERMTYRTFNYEDYDKTWVAYKNKEQAECKGELVELPCKIHDVGYFVDTENQMIVEADVKEILIHCYHKKFATIKITFKQLEGRVLYVDNLHQMCGSEIYWDKEQAEQRLKKLRGKL